MKKYILLFAAVSLLICTGCSDKEPELEIVSDTSISVEETAETSEAEITAVSETDMTAETISFPETTVNDAEITSDSKPAETTSAQTTKAETAATTATTTAATTAATDAPLSDDEESEEAIVNINDEELVGDDESAGAANTSVPFAGTWTASKIADDGGNTYTLKEFCELTEMTESSIKSVFTIKSDGSISASINGKKTDYTYTEADGNLLLQSTDGKMMIMIYDSSKKTITYYDENCGANIILTK